MARKRLFRKSKRSEPDSSAPSEPEEPLPLDYEDEAFGEAIDVSSANLADVDEEMGPLEAMRAAAEAAEVAAAGGGDARPPGLPSYLQSAAPPATEGASREDEARGDLLDDGEVAEGDAGVDAVAAAETIDVAAESAAEAEDDADIDIATAADTATSTPHDDEPDASPDCATEPDDAEPAARTESLEPGPVADEPGSPAAASAVTDPGERSAAAATSNATAAPPDPAADADAPTPEEAAAALQRARVRIQADEPPGAGRSGDETADGSRAAAAPTRRRARSLVALLLVLALGAAGFGLLPSGPELMPEAWASGKGRKQDRKPSVAQASVERRDSVDQTAERPEVQPAPPATPGADTHGVIPASLLLAELCQRAPAGVTVQSVRSSPEAVHVEGTATSADRLQSLTLLAELLAALEASPLLGAVDERVRYEAGSQAVLFELTARWAPTP